MNDRRPAPRLAAIALILPGTLFATAGCHGDDLSSYSPTTSLPDVSFRTAAEHDALMQGRSWPYVLELASARGALLYYGSRHTRDPDDPQIAGMLARWRTFRPTVAVAENCGGTRIGGLR